MTRYRVEVTVGELTGSVSVEADSPEAAKAEAEEVVKSAPVEAVHAYAEG